MSKRRWGEDHDVGDNDNKDLNFYYFVFWKIIYIYIYIYLPFKGSAALAKTDDAPDFRRVL